MPTTSIPTTLRRFNGRLWEAAEPPGVEARASDLKETTTMAEQQTCRDCGAKFPFHPDRDRCPACVLADTPESDWPRRINPNEGFPRPLIYITERDGLKYRFIVEGDMPPRWTVDTYSIRHPLGTRLASGVMPRTADDYETGERQRVAIANAEIEAAVLALRFPDETPAA